MRCGEDCWVYLRDRLEKQGIYNSRADWGGGWMEYGQLTKFYITVDFYRRVLKSIAFTIIPGTRVEATDDGIKIRCDFSNFIQVVDNIKILETEKIEEIEEAEEGEN